MFIPKKENRLSFFSDLFEKTKNSLAEISDDLMLWYNQYKGSYEIDGSNQRACATRNITYEIIESQVDSSIPAPRVETGRYSLRHDRNAKSVERLCLQLRDRLPFEALNDTDERYTYIYGASVWLVEWDSTLESGKEKGGIRISCISPRDFFPQPGITSMEDMEYCFIRFRSTREALCRRWQVSFSDTAAAQCDDGGDDTVCVTLCYYRDDNSSICRYVWSGDLVLEDSPRYFGRKVPKCKKCELIKGSCSCDEPEFVLSDELMEFPCTDMLRSDGSVIPACIPCPAGEGDGGIMSQNGVMYEGVSQKRTRIPYYEPKLFPIVIRKNTSCDGSLFGQSDCEYLRPAQQQINKVESRIMQKLMRSAITPVVPEDAQISVTNQVFGQVIKLRPGESAADYGTVDTTPDISRDILQAQRLYDQAKRIIGISDTYVGLDNSTISGYSRQLQLSQSAGRLESKRRMKNAAYSELDRIIFLYYLAFADEVRCVTYKDAQGRSHNGTFNRYDFIEYDPASGEYIYDDAYLFSVDKNSAVEGQREVMWQKNMENLQAGTLGDPALPSTLLRYWQNQERVHYPYARENVEYFQMMVQSNAEREGGDGCE